MSDRRDDHTARAGKATGTGWRPNRSAARRYAQALFELGSEQGTLDDLEAELGTVIEIIDNNAELQAALQHPRMAAQDKFRVLDEVLSDRVSKQIMNLLRLLVRRRRERHLNTIYEEFRQRCDESRGIVQAQVRSAVALPEATVAELSETLSKATGHDVRVQLEVDPELLGGLVVQIGDRRMDLSLSRKLSALRRHIAAGGEPTEVSGA